MTNNLEPQIEHLIHIMTNDLPRIDKSFSSLRQCGISVRPFTDIRIHSFLGWSKISNQPYIGVNSVNTFPQKRCLVLKELGYLFLVEKWTPFSNHHIDSGKSILHSNLTKYGTPSQPKHHILYRVIHRKRLQQNTIDKIQNTKIINQAVIRLVVNKTAIDRADKFATNKHQFFKRLANNTGLSYNVAKKQYQHIIELKKKNKKHHKTVYSAKKVG